MEYLNSILENSLADSQNIFESFYCVSDVFLGKEDENLNLSKRQLLYRKSLLCESASRIEKCCQFDFLKICSVLAEILTAFTGKSYQLKLDYKEGNDLQQIFVATLAPKFIEDDSEVVYLSDYSYILPSKMFFYRPMEEREGFFRFYPKQVLIQFPYLKEFVDKVITYKVVNWVDKLPFSKLEELKNEFLYENSQLIESNSNKNI